MGAPSIRMPLYCRMPRDFDVPALVTGSALDLCNPGDGWLQTGLPV